ncbi:hypothetical protein C2G38_2233530 [Gigaspora rosea]|uniref:F-box domain-containing protein n=1 Tax=Gigaspora rosea TaxID=44941 RepID=A0A397TS83_9GLOM|nr:hypothetical protein C2G38_2233530 [Gigaspora rosea]
MGDMLELMDIIFNNLKNDLNSLYSCVLVIQHWCKMSIPILWQNPFSFNQKPLFISEYFSSLDKDEIYILKGYGINLEISRKLFNYAKFLKDLDLFLSWRRYPTKFYGIISGLECQKNSLQEVIIKKCAYNKEFEVVDCPIDVHTIPLILEKSGLLLQRLRFISKNSDDIDEELFFLEALNLQKLQFLTLMCNIDDLPEEEMKIRTMKFAEILLSTLEYLDLVDK